MSEALGTGRGTLKSQLIDNLNTKLKEGQAKIDASLARNDVISK